MRRYCAHTVLLAERTLPSVLAGLRVYHCYCETTRRQCSTMPIYGEIHSRRQALSSAACCRCGRLLRTGWFRLFADCCWATRVSQRYRAVTPIVLGSSSRLQIWSMNSSSHKLSISTIIVTSTQLRLQISLPLLSHYNLISSAILCISSKHSSCGTWSALSG